MQERFSVGLDLGQVFDFTAICVCQVEREKKKGLVLTARHLERLRGMLYPDVVTHVGALVRRAPLAGAHELVVDVTGVGTPVGDEFKIRRIRHKKVWIHGGDNENYDEKKRQYNVPKRELINFLALLFHRKAFRMEEDLPLIDIMGKELVEMERKENINTGHNTFVHREGEHDDLVLAAALAAWGAKRMGGGAGRGGRKKGGVRQEPPFGTKEAPFELKPELVSGGFGWG